VDDPEEKGQEECGLHHRPVRPPRPESPGHLHVRPPFRRRYGAQRASRSSIR